MGRLGGGACLAIPENIYQIARLPFRNGGIECPDRPSKQASQTDRLSGWWTELARTTNGLAHPRLV